MPPRVKIKHLKGVTRSILFPLYERAMETQKRNGILHDQKAVEILEQLDYDLSGYESSWLKQLIFAVKTEYIDAETFEFLRLYPDALIINIGAGLDTRFGRVDNQFLTWIDLDLAEVIEIRRFFFPNTVRHRSIAKSMFDLTWFDELPLQPSQAILIIAEGVFMYFDEKDLRILFNQLCNRLPGAEFIFDTFHPIIIEQFASDLSKENINQYKWRIKSVQDIMRMDPRLVLVKEVCAMDLHPQQWRELQFLATFSKQLRQSIRIFHFKISD